MVSLFEFILGSIVCIVAFFFAYMSSHLVSEKKAGHRIPLPWETKDKSYGVSSGEQDSKKKHMDDIL